jgi:endonuclease/exonuclease/phosphatase (EEP) superfamily protein YafD
MKNHHESAYSPVCDYIFVNSQINVKDFRMDETIIYDHNALIVDFNIK